MAGSGIRSGPCLWPSARGGGRGREGFLQLDGNSFRGRGPSRPPEGVDFVCGGPLPWQRGRPVIECTLDARFPSSLLGKVRRPRGNPRRANSVSPIRRMCTTSVPWIRLEYWMNCCKLMSSVRSKLKGTFIGWLCVSGEAKLCVQTCCAKVRVYIYIC